MFIHIVLILFCFLPNLHANENKDDVVKLDNDGEVIYISSLTDYMDNETNSWLWKYSGPEGFGFKVVIKSFESSLINEFSIENTTDILVNKRSAKEFHPYYNNDSYIQIYLTLLENKDTVFVAYLTLIDKHPPKPFFDPNFCPAVNFGKDEIGWFLATFVLPPFFPQRNANCSYDLIVPYKNEVDVSIYAFYIEKNVDILKYSFVTTNNEVTTVVMYPTSFDPIFLPSENSVNINNTFTLEGYTNGSKKHYLWEWTSDGSIVSLPLLLDFVKISCQCASANISCGTSPQGIMHYDDGRYCGNMRCNFTILPCSSGTILMKIEISDCSFDEMIPQPDLLDRFRVYSNDDVVMEINNYNRFEQNYEICLNRSNINIFEAITYSSKIARCLILTTDILPASSPREVILTSSVPYTIIDTGLFKSSVIASEHVNSTYVFMSSKARGAPLYKDINFFKRHISSVCFSEYNPYQCEIVSNKVGISVPSVKDYFPIISIYDDKLHQKGCVFDKYIFIANENSPNTPVSVISTAEDECIATLLLNVQEYVYYTITYLWTNMKDKNVKIYAGRDNPFFEFNSHTTKKWTEINLFSDFYTIIVPKNATLYMRIERQTGGFEPSEYFGALDYESTIAIDVLKPNYYSLLSTPGYGTSKRNENIELITFFFGKYTLKFTTLYYKSNGNIFFAYFKHGSVDIITRINQTGDTFFFNNEMISLAHRFDSGAGMQDGAIFLIEVVN